MINTIFPLISQAANHTVLVTVIVTPGGSSATWVDNAVALFALGY